MGKLIESARRMARGRSSDLATRVAGLEAAIDAARGRLDDDLLAEAHAAVERVQSRLRLSPEHTIVALAGATGSGKSSLFNRLTGLELAAVGVRRPTTSWALACAWPPAGAEDILGWLGIPTRHQVSRASTLDGSDPESQMPGLVLLDLPDHDSTEVSHHLEVERLVQHADVLVWILDPQKYADAAVHDRFLRPLASHAESIVVVVNQVDLLPEKQRDETLRDVRRLLAEDGLADVPLIATSAKAGDGIEELRRELRGRIAKKDAARERLSADVSVLAQRLTEQNGTSDPVGLDGAAADRLVDALADAAGVPVVVDAIERSVRAQAVARTGWPLTRWLLRRRADPLAELHLPRDASVTAVVRSSLPEPTPVQAAAVDHAVREVAESAAQGLTKPWSDAVRARTRRGESDLRDSLDQAVLGADVAGARPSAWWRLVDGLQWLLLLTAMIGTGWLGVLAVMSFLRMPEPETPLVSGVPAPTLLLVVGVVLGLGLAVICRALARRTAARRARQAESRLRSAISGVAADAVIDPVRAEISAYERARAGLATARG